MIEFNAQKLKSNLNTLMLLTALMYFVVISLISALGYFIFIIFKLTSNLSGLYLYYSFGLTAIIFMSLLPLFYLLNEFNNWKTREKEKISKVSNIIGISKPESKIMEFLMPYQSKKLFSIIKLTDSNSITLNPEFVIISESSPSIFSLKTKKNVTVYRENILQDKLIAVDDGKKIIIGNILDKDLLKKIVDNKKKFIFKLIPSIMFLTLLFMLALISLDAIKLYENYYLATESLKWESKNGVIIRSEIKLTKITSGKKKYDGYEALIVYEYEANGIKYKGNNIFFGYEPAIKSEPAQNIINKYPLNARTNILYNPEKPELSVLERSDAEFLKRKINNLHMAMFISFLTVPLAVGFSLLIFPFAIHYHENKILEIIENEGKL